MLSFQGINGAEFRHSGIALVDKGLPAFFIAIRDDTYLDTVISFVLCWEFSDGAILTQVKTMKEFVARGGLAIAVTDDNNGELDTLCEFVIKVPRTPVDTLQTLISVIPLQLFSYYLAVSRGCNVDKPRNLAKSVTVE